MGGWLIQWIKVSYQRLIIKWVRKLRKNWRVCRTLIYDRIIIEPILTRFLAQGVWVQVSTRSDFLWISLHQGLF